MTRPTLTDDMTEQEKIDHILNVSRRRGDRSATGKPQPATEGEKARIVEEFDDVVRGRSARNLHPVDPETGDPLCETASANSPDGPPWPVETFHIEHHDICVNCVGEWRKR